MSNLTYKDAGVDIDAGEELVERIKAPVKRTNRPEVIGGLGGFGALTRIPKGYTEPVLVSGTDGVGTKLRLAIDLNRHSTVGQDLVAMCVNDLIVQGAEPLLFLDYYATAKLDVDVAATVVTGIAKGCEMAGCALIGGETAEMPGFYPEDEYDLAGFSVGIVDRDEMITGDTLKKGHVLIGMASSGIHSNGYSLVRKVFPMEASKLGRYSAELGKSLGEALLTPTKIYVKALKSIKNAGVKVKACSHITGGGFYENIPRMLKEGTRAVINKSSYEVPALFKLLASEGNIEEHMMYNTYNMGIGMVLAVDRNDADRTLAAVKAAGEQGYILGEIDNGEKDIVLK